VTSVAPLFMPTRSGDNCLPRRGPQAAECVLPSARSHARPAADVLSDDAVMTVIGSGTSLEGDRWVLGRDVHDGFSYTYLEVETPNGHHSKGGYGSPPLSPGMRLGTCTQHDDVGPDQIILGVADDVSGVVVTLSDGRRERLMLYSDPTHPGVSLAALVYPRNLDIHRIDLLDASGEPLPDRL
jgi:hypothetical protein